MSRHVPRSERWTKLGPNAYRSEVGRVFFHAGTWNAELCYRVNDPESDQPGEVEVWQATNFKRPRNAMIALEDRETELRRRHQANVAFLPPE